VCPDILYTLHTFIQISKLGGGEGGENFLKPNKRGVWNCRDGWKKYGQKRVIRKINGK